MEVTPDARWAWLVPRIDRRCAEATATTIDVVAEHLAIATGDAVTVRALSADGGSLDPVTAHHPDPAIDAAMSSIMSQTVRLPDTGLWAPVIEARRPRRWHIPEGHVPAEASARQASFLQHYPIRAVLGVPLLVDDRLVGGMSVVRFSAGGPFTDHDEALVLACATRIAPMLDLRARLALVADAAACLSPSEQDEGH